MKKCIQIFLGLLLACFAICARFPLAFAALALTAILLFVFRKHKVFFYTCTIPVLLALICPGFESSILIPHENVTLRELHNTGCFIITGPVFDSKWIDYKFKFQSKKITAEEFKYVIEGNSGLQVSLRYNEPETIAIKKGLEYIKVSIDDLKDVPSPAVIPHSATPHD